MLLTSSEEPVELGSKRHGVDDHRVVPLEAQDADLEYRPVGGRPDEHGQVLTEVTLSQRVA